jgi:hypothetical protein
MISFRLGKLGRSDRPDRVHSASLRAVDGCGGALPVSGCLSLTVMVSFVLSAQIYSPIDYPV